MNDNEWLEFCYEQLARVRRDLKTEAEKWYATIAMENEALSSHKESIGWYESQITLYGAKS